MIDSAWKPSVFRVVQSDYLALILAGFPAVAWGMYIVIAVFGFFPGMRGHDPIRGTEGAPFFLGMAVVATVVMIPLLLWRLKSFQATFARSDEVVGRITSISFFRDRGRIEYSYVANGQIYNGWNAIMKNKRTTSLSEGDEVVLLVDRTDPKRALIRDLYTG
jgi:hypothetical protein